MSPSLPYATLLDSLSIFLCVLINPVDLNYLLIVAGGGGRQTECSKTKCFSPNNKSN